MNRLPFCASVAALVLTTGVALYPRAMAQPPAAPEGSAQPGDAPDPRREMGRRLVEGLRATPGCLGTEVAQTQTGKAVIFAWFEDKKAALAWYRNPAHRGAMARFDLPPTDENHRPLQDVPDDSGPIMVIACLKFSDKPLPGTQAPVSEIAVELYSPLHGGIRVNGGFAPAALKVPGRQDITSPPPAAK